ncbi:bifunctional phosphopantothenoylcysteine decarboxylase/phosphopantothenate--cysteine ligase CoaBC, partial [Neobacillus drentensis]|uniref:bifunctional phosphopantothenoylcysteine decarboxylase/phosphopantothenate--cysteine ligase CoaBC n=1 Tax=Neobacillus drentensis TaxID=220684 RepID=UPI00300145BD
MLNGKTIVLGITGGIAAYKAITLCSRLVQHGANVHVIMSESAKHFVTELTLQTLSRNPVFTDTFDERDPSVVSHIHLADAADMVVIAPATANILAKMTYGLADDMLSTTLLATTAPIVVAPAMNVHMYSHPATVHNMKVLEERGVLFVEPGTGQLACGYVGKGRMAEPEDIFHWIERHFAEQSNIDQDQGVSKPLAGKKLMVTAGGTIERIDPVRYITNDSSGKMGFAIARAAKEWGATVQLIAANTNETLPVGVEVIHAMSAREMYDAVLERMDDADIIIKAAAVADYRPVKQAPHKMKKSSERLTLELERTEDILQKIGELKKHQFVVGFAAETHDVDYYAQDKLKRKNCDFIVANDVTAEG